MKIGFLWFSCLRDVTVLECSLRSVRASLPEGVAAEFLVAVDAAELAVFPSLPGVVLVETTFARGRSLNGLACCVGMVEVYGAVQRRWGLDYVVKLDSDVVQVGARFVARLQAGLESGAEPIGFLGYANAVQPRHALAQGWHATAASRVSYAFASGGAYVMGRELLRVVWDESHIAEGAAAVMNAARAEMKLELEEALLDHDGEVCQDFLEACGWPEDETLTSYFLAVARACLPKGAVVLQLPELPHGWRFFRRWPYASTRGTLPDRDAAQSLALTADFVEVRDLDAMRGFLPERAQQMRLAKAVMLGLTVQVELAATARRAAAESARVRVATEAGHDDGYRIALLVQGTGPYLELALKALESAATRAWPQCVVEFVLFSDVEPPVRMWPNGRVVHWVPTAHRPVPWVTHLRFHQMLCWINMVRVPYTHVAYLDADSRVLETLAPEAMFETDLFCTTHPFHDGGAGAACRTPVSQAYIPPGETWPYVCGAFYGGRWEAFVALVEACALATTVDLANGVIAQWHDESMLNHFLWKNAQRGLRGGHRRTLTRLHSGYCWQAFTAASHKHLKVIENTFDGARKAQVPWADWPRRGSEWAWVAETSALCAAVLDAGAASVLEVGAGAGQLEAWLGEAGFGGTYQGVEADAARVAAPSPGQPSGAVMVRSLGQPLPMRTHGVDVVVLWRVLEHCVRYEALLFECVRVARKRVLVLWGRPPVLGGAPAVASGQGGAQPTLKAWQMEHVHQFLLSCGATSEWRAVAGVGGSPATLQIISPISPTNLSNEPNNHDDDNEEEYDEESSWDDDDDEEDDGYDDEEEVGADEGGAGARPAAGA